ncbi:MAG: hypothetical protein JWN15_2041, partial [Firmicutes bacterium]|nr:hypothetical protein [Bacillota bacterium]
SGTPTQAKLAELEIDWQSLGI